MRPETAEVCVHSGTSGVKVMRRLFSVFAMVLGFALVLPGLAQAHPHVWVVMRSALVYAPDGTLTGLKQEWTFDEAFSAFALQGLAKQADGSYGDDVLKPLAEVNISSLKEFDYFVTAKNAVSRLRLKDPVDYYLTHEGNALILHFTLPLEKPAPARNQVSIDIYDPTLFVAFEFAPKDAVKLEGAPEGCTEKVTSPQPMDMSNLSEDFFENLSQTSTYGAQFADKIVVKCP